MSRSSPITAQQWSQVQRLLDELELLPRPARWEALATREVPDPRVREEVESLIDAESRSEGFLEDSPWLDTQPRTNGPALAPGTMLGTFRVEDLIGRGGMAEVYRAQRVGEFDQRVAIKLISGEANSRLDAFQRERRILATLEHTGISRIVDGGITEGGRSYMVMEYVEGTDLIRHAQERRLDLAARLDLFRQVCEAVSYAHRHLIIHRDLKPGNIRVTPTGQVKLLDFGVAKLLQPEGRTEDFETATILTPEFAAPEQLYGLPVTTATDVYALGAVLFHLLCGVPPFRTEGRAMHLVIDQMLRSEMPQPSSVAAGQPDPPIPPRHLRGDLDAIVARATRKKPADRYPTVDELWADVSRHQAHLPVVARRGNTLYEVGRTLRRHRVAMTAGAAIAVVLLAGLVGTLWQARAAVRAEREAVAQAQRTKRTKDFFVATFAGASALHRKDGTPATLGDALDDALRRIDTEQADDPRLQADLLSDFGEIRAGQGDLHGAKALFERALALHEKLLAPDDPVLANTVQNRGVIETFLGHDDLALPYLRRAVAIRQAHPDDADELIFARMSLATAEQNLGHTSAALEQMLEVIRYGRLAPDERHQILADALIRASFCAMELQRVDDAKAWAADALSLYAEHFGPASGFNVAPLRMLARVAIAERDPVTERALRERAVRIAQSSYPDGGHPDVAATLLELGTFELRVREIEAGERHLVAAIAASELARAEDLNRLQAYMRLAQSRLRQNRLAEAMEAQSAAAALCGAEGLPGSPGACPALRALGLRLKLALSLPPGGLLAQAQSEHAALLARRAKGGDASGVSEVEIIETGTALAHVLSALGRHAEAAVALREVVAAQRMVVGGSAVDLDGARWELVRSLALAGSQDALDEADRLLKTEKAEPGADEARRLLAAAEFERSRGRIEIASAHAQSALRLIGALGPGEERLRVGAGALSSSLH